jgi:hypothetical protein
MFFTEGMVNLLQNFKARGKQHHGDNNGKKRFVFPVPVWMLLIGRMGGDPDADQTYHVRRTVENGVKSVRDHCNRVGDEAVEYFGEGDDQVQD